MEIKHQVIHLIRISSELINNNVGPSQRPGPNGNIKNNYNFNNNRQQNPTYSTNNNVNRHNNNNKVTNSFGNRFHNNSNSVNPNVQNALSALHKDNSKDGRFLRNAVQKAMVVEQAALTLYNLAIWAL